MLCSVMLRVTLSRRAAAEAVGTALLLATIVGSGIMGAELSNGLDGLALLANAVATGAGLAALILVFGPISGAHFNPVVSLASAWRGTMRWNDVAPYIAAQLTGAVVGVLVAHAMFDLPLVEQSLHARAGGPQVLSEAVATFGLLSVVIGCGNRGVSTGAAAVSLYITGAYWFTASTSFANPAVTIARSLTNTFAGIRPVDTPAFVFAQCVGTTLAVMLWGWMLTDDRHLSEEAR